MFEMTLTQLDNDAMGVYFYYKDPNNYYRFAMDGETNRRQLVKVADGKAVLLAEVNEGTPFNMDIPLTVAVVGGTINVFLGDKNVFGGPVVDATAPLSGGTVGVYSSGQRASVFDDIVVTGAGTTAKAGIDQRAYDIDGDGKASVTLDASGSFGPEQLTGFVWTDLKGNVVATGKKVDVALDTGVNKLLLKVTAANGSVSTDRIDVTVVDRTKILVAEDFSSAEAMARFKIVDEGEFGGIGADGKSSEWLISNGKLLQTTELASRELTGPVQPLPTITSADGARWVMASTCCVSVHMPCSMIRRRSHGRIMPLRRRSRHLTRTASASCSVTRTAKTTTSWNWMPTASSTVGPAMALAASSTSCA